MTETPKVSAAKNRGLQDDHDPNDIGQRTANRSGQGIVRDDRGQEQPVDKKRAQQPDSKKEQSQMEVRPPTARTTRVKKGVEATMTFPKNQQTRQRGKTLGEAGAEPFGFDPKPMLNEHHERKLLGGHGLIGSDKSQGELRDVDAIRGSRQMWRERRRSLGPIRTRSMARMSAALRCRKRKPCQKD